MGQPWSCCKVNLKLFLKYVRTWHLERFSTLADEFRSRCQLFQENTLLTALYLKSRVLGNRISIMVCFVFPRYDSDAENKDI